MRPGDFVIAHYYNHSPHFGTIVTLGSEVDSSVEHAELYAQVRKGSRRTGLLSWILLEHLSLVSLEGDPLETLACQECGEEEKRRELRRCSGCNIFICPFCTFTCEFFPQPYCEICIKSLLAQQFSQFIAQQQMSRAIILDTKDLLSHLTKRYQQLEVSRQLYETVGRELSAILAQPHPQQLQQLQQLQKNIEARSSIFEENSLLTTCIQDCAEAVKKCLNASINANGNVDKVE